MTRLDELLRKARLEEPMVSRQEVRALVERLPVAKRPLIITTSGMIIMAILLLTVLTFFMLTIPGDRKDEIGAKVNRRPDSLTQAVVIPESNAGPQTKLAVRRRPMASSQVPQRHNATFPLGLSRKKDDTISAPIREYFPAPGVRLIESTEALWDSLGIKNDTGGTILFQAIGWNQFGDTVMIIQLPTSRRARRLMSVKEAPRQVGFDQFPRMVTNSKGQQEYSKVGTDQDRVPDEFTNIFTDSNATKEQLREASDRLSREIANRSSFQNLFDVRRLIPIKVDCGRALGDSNEYFIFWYEPTPRFLAMLPQEVLQRMHRELTDVVGNDSLRAAMLRTVGGALSNHDVESIRNREDTRAAHNSAQPGSTYFDLSNATSGSIEIRSVSPNPTSGTFFTRLQLSRDCSLSIALYDLHGNSILDLYPTTSEAQGSFDHLFTIPGSVPDGIYMMVVTSDIGERAVQRLVLHR